METTSKAADERPAGRARALGYKGLVAAFGLTALLAGCSGSGGDNMGNRDEETPESTQPSTGSGESGTDSSTGGGSTGSGGATGGGSSSGGTSP